MRAGWASLSNKTLLKYLSVSYLAIPVSLITGFIAFRNIDPYYMGIWATLSVFETLSVVLRFGVVNGMNREYPFALGQNKRGDAAKYAETTLAFTIFDIFVLLLLTPFAFWYLKLNSDYTAALIVSLTRVVLTFYVTYLSATFRSEDNFEKLSAVQFYLLVLKLVTCPLVLLGFNGFLIYELLGILLNVILLHNYRPLRNLKPKLHFSELKKLLAIGFPIFLSSYSVSFIDTLPRLFIIKNSDEKTLGLYAPVVLLLSTVSVLPNTLSTYLYPKFSFQIGRSNDPRAVFSKMLKIYAVSFIAILALVFIGYFLIDYVMLYFPKYGDATPYIKLALLICPFVFFRLGNMFNVVTKKYSFMFLFALVYGVAQIASLYILKFYLNDVLDIVIYSQVITAVIVLAFSIGQNYLLVLALEKNRVDHGNGETR